MKELRHQQLVIKWSQQPKIRRKWPCLKLLHHVPNERFCSPAMGKQLKLAGVRRGVPDLELPVARGQYHSLRIEMKRPGETATPDQDWWANELRAEGNFVETCHGYESAIRVLEWYLGL